MGTASLLCCSNPGTAGPCSTPGLRVSARTSACMAECPGWPEGDRTALWPPPGRSSCDMAAAGAISCRTRACPCACRPTGMNRSAGVTWGLLLADSPGQSPRELEQAAASQCQRTLWQKSRCPVLLGRSSSTAPWPGQHAQSGQASPPAAGAGGCDSAGLEVPPAGIGPSDTVWCQSRGRGSAVPTLQRGSAGGEASWSWAGGSIQLGPVVPLTAVAQTQGQVVAWGWDCPFGIPLLPAASSYPGAAAPTPELDVLAGCHRGTGWLQP